MRQPQYGKLGTSVPSTPGDTLRLTLSTTDVAYLNSRTSAGVRIDTDASEVRLPVRGESGVGEEEAAATGEGGLGAPFSASR